MKAHIGPYRRDLIPIRRWEERYEFWSAGEGKYYKDENEYTWYDKIVFGFFDWLDKLFRPINRWSNKCKRNIKIRIDDYDCWSADHTLAMIIHPVLKKLNEQKQGSPCVEDDDVPDHLKSTSAPPKEHDWDTDDNHHARWEYVMNEMVWAFYQHTLDSKGGDQFHHNSDQLDLKFVPVTAGKYSDKGYSSLNVIHQKDPTKPAYWVDEEGKKAHYKRISNGIRLFAKYYDGLWD